MDSYLFKKDPNNLINLYHDGDRPGGDVVTSKGNSSRAIESIISGKIGYHHTETYSRALAYHLLRQENRSEVWWQIDFREKNSKRQSTCYNT